MAATAGNNSLSTDSHLTRNTHRSSSRGSRRLTHLRTAGNLMVERSREGMREEEGTARMMDRLR
jgi:hypothetical protein